MPLDEFSHVPKFGNQDLNLDLLLRAGEGEKATITQKLIGKEKERIAKMYPNLSEREIISMIRTLLEKEFEHSEALFSLAGEMIQKELGVPKAILDTIVCKLGQENYAMDGSEFENPHQKKEKADFTEEEQRYIAREQVVRQLQNFLIAGAGYQAFDWIENPIYKEQLDTLDSELSPLYRQVIGKALHDMLNEENAGKARNNVGKSELTKSPQGGMQIEASGLLFPILLHETVKGVMEFIFASRRNGKRQEVIEEILSVDTYAEEQLQMVVGPQLWKQFQDLARYALGEFEDNYGLDGKTKEEYLYALYVKLNSGTAKNFRNMFLMMNDGEHGQQAVEMMMDLISEIHDQYVTYRQQSVSTKQKLVHGDEIRQTLSVEKQPKSLGEERLERNGTDLLCFLKDFYPLETKAETIRKNFIKKLTEYFMEHPNADTSLVPALKEKLGMFSSELTRIEALKQLQGQKSYQTKPGETVRITNEELAKRENLLKNDEKRQYQLRTKIGKIVAGQPLSGWLALHDQHTKEINAYYRKFFDVSDIPPTEIAQVGEFAIVDLQTEAQLRDESTCMSHCVGNGSYYDKVKSGKTKIFSIKTGNKSQRTIEYDVKSQSIQQFKGSHNALPNSHKQEIINMLVAIVKKYPITSVGKDLQGIIPQGNVLRNDGTQAPVPKNEKEVLKNYLQGKTIIIGERPTFVLDETYTVEQVTKLCSYVDLKLDLTKVSPTVKAQLVSISAKVVDSSINGDSLFNYPKLRMLAQPLTTVSHTVFYEEKKKQFNAMETYKWNEQQRKQDALNFLKANDMDTPKNRRMIEDVKFTEKAIIIGGVPFSNTQLIPQNVERKEKNKWDVCGSSKKGLWKKSYQGEEGYYYDLDAYISECKEQGKKSIMKEDIEKALKALPGTYSVASRYAGGNILSLLLGLPMSGGVNSDGEPFFAGYYGCLGSASSRSSSDRWCCRWGEAEGGLYDDYDRGDAFPGLFLVQNSGK